MQKETLQKSDGDTADHRREEGKMLKKKKKIKNALQQQNSYCRAFWVLIKLMSEDKEMSVL